MIETHHREVVLPMHNDNLRVQNGFREELAAAVREVRALSKRIDDWFAELRGRDMEKKEQLEHREKEERASATKREQATAKSAAYSGWTLVIVSIVSVIVVALGIWVSYLIATRPSSHPIVIGNDPSIHEEK
jgi:anti-sigma-K factor RskA